MGVMKAMKSAMKAMKSASKQAMKSANEQKKQAMKSAMKAMKSADKSATKTAKKFADKKIIDKKEKAMMNADAKKLKKWGNYGEWMIKTGDSEYIFIQGNQDDVAKVNIARKMRGTGLSIL